MNDERPRARPRPRNYESVRKEAKRWLAAIEADLDDARARLMRAIPAVDAVPTLRDVQHALAREYGFEGWPALKDALAPDASLAAQLMEQYSEKAQALLDAYRTGTPEALERHHNFTWHRREWSAMRSYVQLDLGKRPTTQGGDVEITLDDARYLIAIEHGFENWNVLQSHANALPSGFVMTASPVAVLDSLNEDAKTIVLTRDWGTVLHLLSTSPDCVLNAHGQMTDAMLDQVTRIAHVTTLHLGNSKALTDDGIQCLARLPMLRHLDLSQTSITDRGLAVLRDLRELETLKLVMTSITDDGLTHLSHCHSLKRLNLMWTDTGSGPIRALAGNANFTHFQSGNLFSDSGFALLHELPAFAVHGENVACEPPLMAFDQGPNLLMLRGPFTDRGMEQLRGLDGLYGLNVDDASLAITARALEPLVSRPQLGKLAVDAKDDWMPIIARMPALKHLGIQDTTASDEGFVSLSHSQSIEQIWGRRCHGLRGSGFRALAHMPRLSGLSVSCLNVEDGALAALPDFPSLRELMPMDIPDAGYRHIAKCANLEALTLMYCRDTTDAATEHLAALTKLKRYFNSYTTISDRTPELLSSIDSLEDITFDACHGLTNAGVARLARLPHLRKLRVAGRGLSRDVAAAFPVSVTVHYSH